MDSAKIRPYFIHRINVNIFRFIIREHKRALK